jgi:hypothetical protein
LFPAVVVAAAATHTAADIVDDLAEGSRHAVDFFSTLFRREEGRRMGINILPRP